MHLVGIQIQDPDGSVAGDARDYCSIVRGSFRQEIAQRAGIPSPAGTGQLEFDEQPVSEGEGQVFLANGSARLAGR